MNRRNSVLDFIDRFAMVERFLSYIRGADCSMSYDRIWSGERRAGEEIGSLNVNYIKARDRRDLIYIWRKSY